MKFLKKLFGKRSASVVRKRLEQVLATDRLNTAPCLMDKIQQVIKDVLRAELAINEIFFDFKSKREGAKTELSFNISFAADMQKPAA